MTSQDMAGLDLRLFVRNADLGLVTTKAVDRSFGKDGELPFAAGVSLEKPGGGRYRAHAGALGVELKFPATSVGRRWRQAWLAGAPVEPLAVTEMPCLAVRGHVCLASGIDQGFPITPH